MKGYGLLALLVMGTLMMMPTLFVSPSVPPTTEGQAESTQAEEVPSAFTVAHTNDASAQSEMSAYDLTLYETMASIAADAPEEAIKAQTVISYTAFCYQQRSREEGGADVTSTALPFPEAFSAAYWQAQWGDRYEEYSARFRSAADAVFGQRILYDGAPIMAVHHTMNSGQTEAATVLWESDVPYLQPVASAADALALDQLTTVTVAVEEAKAVLATLVPPDSIGDAASWFSEAVQTEAGTVTSISVCGTALTGWQLKEAFSLPSAAFEVQVQGDAVIFTVHGRGHFVGLSVTGAIAMAADGAAYDTILKHYYTGVTVA